MKRLFILYSFLLLLSSGMFALTPVPLDTSHWEITARSHVFEHYKGKDAVYIQGGIAKLKDVEFLNGTIEFDVYLTERQSFPGLRFRARDQSNMESFFLRPHLSGKPDANQAAPVINSITPWQLYFGPSYSFEYEYNFDGWTHIKLIVNGDKAQVFLDYSEAPHLSWNLVHPAHSGAIGIGGSFAPVHYANFSIDHEKYELTDFNPIKRAPIEGLIESWQISDKFEEVALQDLSKIKTLIRSRKWGDKIKIDEGTAANIARGVKLYDETRGNTVFAKLTIRSDKDQIKLFEFGYSDRVVAILNDVPIYKGNNKWRSRDYRYLGTIGLFDAIYLDLKKGENTLLLAVSEDFGGWLVTGKFKDEKGLLIK